jgi:hypothetical protein
VTIEKSKVLALKAQEYLSMLAVETVIIAIFVP